MCEKVHQNDGFLGIGPGGAVRTVSYSFDREGAGRPRFGGNAPELHVSRGPLG